MLLLTAALPSSLTTALLRPCSFVQSAVTLMLLTCVEVLCDFQIAQPDVVTQKRLETTETEVWINECLSASDSVGE